MSDLSAAAAALGVPEAIVQRSAVARATETGMTVDEVLAAWAGGGSVAGAPPAATGAEAAEPEAPPAAEPPVAAPPAADRTSAASPTSDRTSAASPTSDRTSAASPTAGETPAGPPAEQGDNAAPVTTVSGRPPVLVGKVDNPIAVLVGAVGLFIAVFLVGLVGPALPVDEPGARSSDLPYSEAALRGQEIYVSVECSSCHTQMVRPIVSDIGLGAVTLSDSDQILGSRRFGPDLSDAGSRLSGSQIEAIITGFGGHPALSLSTDDLEALVTYLVESKTSVAAPAAASEEESG